MCIVFEITAHAGLVNIKNAFFNKNAYTHTSTMSMNVLRSYTINIAKECDSLVLRKRYVRQHNGVHSIVINHLYPEQ